MAGFVASGIARGEYPQIRADQLDSVAREAEAPTFLLDVRTPEEFAAGAITGAINIPIDDLRSRLAAVPSDRLVVVYCAAGQRGYLATRMLRQHGRDATNLSGGYKSYRMYFPS